MRRLLAALLAVPLAGCVNPTDPMRLAARGPTTETAILRADRPLQPGDRVALAVVEESVDRARLLNCVSQGMQARLPSGVGLVSVDEPRSAALRDLAAAREPGFDGQAAGLGADWAVLVRDGTSRSEASANRFIAEGAGGSGALGVQGGTETAYSLRLDAVLLDLRGRRRLGRASAFYFARGGGRIAVGVAGMGAAGAGVAWPFVMPIIDLPAGTSAMAICNAFGRSVGEALVAATASPPLTADAPAPAEIPSR